jgi:hypothetical protein
MDGQQWPRSSEVTSGRFEALKREDTTALRFAFRAMMLIFGTIQGQANKIWETQGKKNPVDSRERNSRELVSRHQRARNGPWARDRRR